ncbi:hypothetical protein [uncultured Brachybacterium sp.]|uniref:hypothetical protein n=1 Tax=uncultured Brachybacterium sp. TaxID=189680 RepID=UPI00261EE53B|nr:hypothetical protein [uncultured Brachybacterium sp.]
MDQMRELRKQTAAARGTMRRAWATKTKKEREQMLREADRQLGDALQLMSAVIVATAD